MRFRYSSLKNILTLNKFRHGGQGRRGKIVFNSIFTRKKKAYKIQYLITRIPPFPAAPITHRNDLSVSKDAVIKTTNILNHTCTVSTGCPTHWLGALALNTRAHEVHYRFIALYCIVLFSLLPGYSLRRY